MTDRHQFDKADDVRFLSRQFDEVGKFIIVKSAQGHHVELHGSQSHSLRRFNPRQYSVEISAPGDLCKLVRIHRIDADIDTIYTGFLEIFRHIGKQNTVRGNSDFVDPIDSVNLSDQIHDSVTYQRLAAGEAHFGDSHLCGRLRQPYDFFEGQNLLLRNDILKTGFRHTVSAP